MNVLTRLPPAARNVSFIVWSVLEPAVALTCACLPTIRPLLRVIYQKASKKLKKISPLQSFSQSHQQSTVAEQAQFQPIRGRNVTQVHASRSSTQVYMQYEGQRVYSLECIQSPRPFLHPVRISSCGLDRGPPTPPKDVFPRMHGA